jgi:tight adherence protein B
MLLIAIFVVMLLVIAGLFLLITAPTTRQKIFEKRLSSVALGHGPRAEEPADIIKRVTYSESPLVDALLKKYSFTRNLKNLLSEANSSWTVTQLLLGTLILLAGVPLVCAIWLSSFLVRFALGALIAAIPYIIVRVQREHRLHRFEVRLPDAIDLICRGLRAGHSISSAIQMVGQEVRPPVGPEFRKCFEQQNFGLPFREALEGLEKRIPIPDLQFLVTAILVQKESGGNLVEVLDKTAVVIRERLRIKGELGIYTAQGRLTGWILGLLPFVLFVMLSFINPQYTGILLEDPTGQKLIFAGIVGMVLGFYTIRRIVDIKV